MKSAGLAFVTKISSFLAQNQMGLIAVALKSSLPAIYTLLSSGEFWSPLRMQTKNQSEGGFRSSVAFLACFLLLSGL